MKLLLDQGLPRTAAELLRVAGFDTLHVGDVGYATATDAAILQLALGEQRIVVTLDADFHALLALSAAPKRALRSAQGMGRHPFEAQAHWLGSLT